MESKFEFFSTLPVEIQQEAVDWLPRSGVYHSVTTSKQNSVFFKPVLDARKPLKDFLYMVVQGEHEKAKALLENNIHLLVEKDQVTDCSNRTFDNISGFEYALWALDKHMWTMMLNCLPKNEAGKQILVKLLNQYDKLNTNGVTYTLNGTAITEQHFDFKNIIIKELQTQVDLINAEADKNLGGIEKQWKNGVGGAQRLLPMHVVDEYCSNDPFYPVPNFTSQPTSSKKFFNWITGKDEDWFHDASKLSVDFAIYKAEALAVGDRVGRTGASRRIELDALEALYEVRTKDFIDLKSQLEEQMSLDNRYQVVTR